VPIRPKRKKGFENLSRFYKTVLLSQIGGRIYEEEQTFLGVDRVFFLWYPVFKSRSS